MSEGRKRLRDWIVRSKLNQRQAAKLLGMHWTLLNQLLSPTNKRRSISLPTALRIERVTGIPVEAWMPTDVAGEPSKRRRKGRQAAGRQTINSATP